MQVAPGCSRERAQEAGEGGDSSADAQSAQSGSREAMGRPSCPPLTAGFPAGGSPWPRQFCREGWWVHLLGREGVGTTCQLPLLCSGFGTATGLALALGVEGQVRWTCRAICPRVSRPGPAEVSGEGGLHRARGGRREGEEMPDSPWRSRWPVREKPTGRAQREGRSHVLKNVSPTGPQD